ncbi:hypothetical protein QTP88_022218 [Uroleucon formosanum]
MSALLLYTSNHQAQESETDNENIKKPNVTVLEAVMWITAAFKKINKELVTKCFIKAAFPGSDNIGKLTQDYSSINECLQTEDLSLNIKDIINDGMSENESHDVEQEKDSTDGVDEEKITLKEALQLANRLKTFCLNKSDAVSLSLNKAQNMQTMLNDFIRKLMNWISVYGL